MSLEPQQSYSLHITLLLEILSIKIGKKISSYISLFPFCSSKHSPRFPQLYLLFNGILQPNRSYIYRKWRLWNWRVWAWNYNFPGKNRWASNDKKTKQGKIQPLLHVLLNFAQSFYFYKTQTNLNYKSKKQTKSAEEGGEKTSSSQR